MLRTPRAGHAPCWPPRAHPPTRPNRCYGSGVRVGGKPPPPDRFASAASRLRPTASQSGPTRKKNLELKAPTADIRQMRPRTKRRNATLLALATLALAGCTQTKVTSPTWGMSRLSILQKVEIPQLTVGTNGTAELRGYTNDGGQQITLDLAGSSLPAYELSVNVQAQP